MLFAYNENKKILPYIIDDNGNGKFPPELKLILSSINQRNIEEHPFETVLIADILHLLDKRWWQDSEKLEGSLRVCSDIDCRYFINGKEGGQLTANELKILSLENGQCDLKFTSIQNPVVSKEKEVVVSHNFELIDF